MADGELGERTEAPTGRRISQSRQDGKVAKSQDLSAVVSLASGLILVLVFGSWIMTSLAAITRQALAGELGGGGYGLPSMFPAAAIAAEEIARLLLPIFVLLAIAAYIAQFAQVRWLFTTKPLVPKVSRLNPVSGAKRLMGKRNTVKSIISLVKLTVVIVVAWAIIMARLDRLATIPRLDAAPAMLLVGQLVVELAAYLLLLLLLIAAADYFYQRWQHTEDLKMTKQEVKDERKMNEGDPELKRERMKRYQKIVYQRLGDAVPDADVIINNPTHFSVALKYDSEQGEAPIVTAKGADHMAMRIRHLAQQHRVPMVTRPPLARALYWGVEVGQPIAPEHYQAVAEVLAYVYRIDERAERNEAQRRRQADEAARRNTTQAAGA